MQTAIKPLPDEYIEVANPVREIAMLDDEGDCVDSDPDAEAIANALLEGHSKWARQKVGPKSPTPMGITVGIAGVREGSTTIVLSDDEFLVIEQSMLSMLYRWRQILELEYRSLWKGRHWLLSQPAKHHKLGLKRNAYEKRLSAALGSFYTIVRKHVDIWRKQSINSAQAERKRPRR